MNSLLPFTGTILCGNNQEQMATFGSQVIDHIKRHGYCVVQMKDSTPFSLLTLRELLGRGQHHIRGNRYGVVSISPSKSSSDRKIDESHYFGTTNRYQPPHTDGAYLNGFVWLGNAYKRLSPPSIVALQCVQPASQGGASILIDTQRILRDLLVHHPAIARILLSPGCVSFCRDDQMALDVAVYERLSPDRWRVRFRCDEALYVSDWANSAVQFFYHRYILNQSYQRRIHLTEGQILVVDNFRVLHGRDSFGAQDEASDRYFRRVWVLDESDTSWLVNFQEQNRACPALERCIPYAPVEESVLSQQLDLQQHKPMSLGVRLPKQMRVIVDGLYSRLLPEVS
jgi:Taurine catabolism dioxygenase TauD, TfdA family